MNIEIFSTQKSCEQGCPTCPLARKENVIAAKNIDLEVQTSFSLLEKILHQENIQYDLHTTSSLHLFPKIAHPKLIRMSRFETNKETRLENKAKLFAHGIHELLMANTIDSKIIGFSLVPQSPVVSEKDIVVMRNIFNELQKWYFTSKNKTVEVTLRSNLIKLDLFEKVKSQLLDADEMYVKKLIEEYTAVCTAWSKKTLSNFIDGPVYYNSYEGKIGYNKIRVINRVIAEQKTNHSIEATIKQADACYPYRIYYAGIAVAPKGVMLMHTSLGINNPIFWLTHEDFRKTLSDASSKQNFSMLRFIQRTLSENVSMYKTLMPYLKEGIQATTDNFPPVFEEYRPKITAS